MNVAAYCRVSTDREDQANSLENQELFFHEFITKNPKWRLVKIYSDEGVSGTSVTKRASFNEMIDTAKSGGIDLIVTKEVSRFARNTVDTLNYTRELKRHGVGVFFINDNINTLDNDGEFRLSIMASVAQEESRKISSRVKWGMQRQMERGCAFTPPIIGYDYDNGNLIINEEEAKIVRRIYHMYTEEGYGSGMIARTFAKEGVPICKRIHCWSPTLIMRIIKNEKYVGDLISKKTITTDYLTHKVVVNKDIEDKLYFKDHHEPIVSRETWEKAQQICEGRFFKDSAPPASAHLNRYWSSGKIICSECGGKFVSKSKSTKKGAKRYYRCSHTTHLKGSSEGCLNRTYLDERALEYCAQYVMRKITIDSDKIIDTLKKAISKLGKDNSDMLSSEDELKKIEQKKQKLLGLLLDETITKQDYQSMVDNLNAKVSEINKRSRVHREELERRKNIEYQINSITAKAEEYLAQKEPTPYLYAKIIDKIVAYPYHRVDIYIADLEIPFSIGYKRSGKGESYKVSCYDYPLPQNNSISG